MRLLVNQVAFGLQRGVLGATANRMGVWTQGCSLRKCPGCTSPHTWGRDGGTPVRVTDLVAMATAQPLRPSGLTVSGGEPSDQPDAVAALIDAFRAAFPEGEIVLYSGLPFDTLRQRHPQLAARPDVVVAGPFVRGSPATALAGSDNQEVHLQTPLAERLYHDWRQWPRHAVQVGTGPDGVVTVGIPDSHRLKAARHAVTRQPPPSGRHP